MTSAPKVKWILSPDVFKENLIALRKEIVRQGHEYIDIEKYFQFRVDGVNDLGDESQPALFYGSIESGQYILKNSKIYPGVYCNLKRFRCSDYYPFVTKYLINNPHTFLPFGCIKSQVNWLYKQFGQDRTIFVRPDRGDKLFTGMLVAKEKLSHELDCVRCNPEDMVVISVPEDIDEEFRLVYCGSDYITGSMYKLRGKSHKEDESSVPANVIELANKAVKLYQPEKVFVIDIGITYNGPAIVEYNSFSCSGLYKCNLEKVVKAVSNVVIEDWKEIYDQNPVKMSG